MRIIAAIPAAGLLAGAAAGLVVADPPVGLALALLFTTVAFALVAYALPRPFLFACAVAFGFFVGAMLLASVEWQRAWRPPLRLAFEQLAQAERTAAAAEGRRLPDDDEAFATVEGMLRADASPGPSGVSLSIAVDHVDDRQAQQARVPIAMEREGFSRALTDFARPTGSGSIRLITGGVLVTVAGSLATDRIDEWRAGRRVRLPVQLRRPSRYLDPGVPDHERALARSGTTLVGTVKSGVLVDVVARGSPLAEAMASARAFVRRAIAGAVGRWSSQSAAIVTAIVIGDRAGLDDEIQQRLQEAGTYHVIAISGGNIAILAGLLLGAFRLAGWLGRTAMLSASGALVVYAMLVGGGASVDRATLMAVVYFGARAFDQRSPPLNALAFVAALLVLAGPISIADPAFLLTFGATLAILVVVPAVVTTINAAAFDAKAAALSVVIRPCVAMFVASAAVEAMLLPIGALLFSRVTFAGLALNFLAIPLMSIAQIAGMAVVPASAISTHLAAAIGWIAHAGAAGLVRSAALVGFVPALAWRVAAPSWPVVVIYYGALAGWWAGRGAARRSRIGWVCALLAAVASLWILIDPRTLIAAGGDGRLHVTFIDVGQGDATFVRFPRGSTLLVDAGGLAFSSGFDIGDRVVAPVLRDGGVRRLDYLALTHGDPDHIGGAGSIIREFRPREVWEGIPVPRSTPLTTLRAQAQASGARWANVYAGDHIALDGTEVFARHPAVADWERQRVRNDDSIVLEIRWRDVSIVLTGDIGRGAEPAVAAATPPARLRIIKVPHHGSLTSSSPAFVAALHPAIAVVSAGRGNHFGHPAPEVLERYEAAGAEIFRTDRDGAVMVDTDGASITVRTMTGRHAEMR
jgi:competence protein ComEC